MEEYDMSIKINKLILKSISLQFIQKYQDEE